MKKVILSLVVASAIAVANDYNFEATVAGGKTYYSSDIGGSGVENVATGHVSLQYNDMIIKPQFAFEGTIDTNYKGSDVETGTYSIFLNGVYEFTEDGIVPYVLAGVGREDVRNGKRVNFNDTILGNVGVGVKIPLFSALALKLEARYMKRFDGGEGSEKVILAGLTMGFWKKSTDDDNDGVLNTVDKCPNTPAGTIVDSTGCKKKAKIIVAPKPKVEKKVVAEVQKKEVAAEIVYIKGINFNTGSARIRNQHKNDLNKMVTYLNDNPTANVEIGGHTDSRGSARYNQRLSERRAIAVKAYLTGNGIDGSRINATGYGEAHPISTNDTRKGRLENRRIGQP